MRIVKGLLFRIARIKPLGSLVGVFFQYLPFALPFKVLAETRSAICFAHPVPMKPYHYLVIPKRRIQTIFDLIVAKHRDIVIDILTATERATGSKTGRYKIGVNYGLRQDVMQVHFHLTDIESMASVRPHTATAIGMSKRVDVNCVADGTILYSWQINASQLTRLTAELNSAHGGADPNTIPTHGQIADLLIQTCQQHGAMLASARALTLYLELEADARGVSWSRSVYFTMEGLPSSSLSG